MDNNDGQETKEEKGRTRKTRPTRRTSSDCAARESDAMFSRSFAFKNRASGWLRVGAAAAAVKDAIVIRVYIYTVTLNKYNI